MYYELNGRKKVRIREYLLQHGTASEYIMHDGIERGDRVVLACRVSTCEQHRDRNLADQELHLRQEMERRGAVVVDVVREVGPGCYPSWLARAADIARRRGAKVVAESLSRLIRSPYYHSVDDPDARPRTSDLDDLRASTKGVELVTLLDPDATPRQERGYQSIRGQRQKRRRGGRPLAKRPGYVKARRERLLPHVLADRRNGMTVRAIAEKHGLPFTTVALWLRRRPR